MRKSTVLELSTVHMTRQDDEILNYMGQKAAHPGYISPINMGSTECGYVIFLTTDDEYGIEDMMNEVNEWLDEPIPARLSNKRLSESFWNVLRLAKEQGHRCVYFDRDADVVDGLPEHDW